MPDLRSMLKMFYRKIIEAKGANNVLNHFCNILSFYSQFYFLVFETSNTAFFALLFSLFVNLLDCFNSLPFFFPLLSVPNFTLLFIA